MSTPKSDLSVLSQTLLWLLLATLFYTLVRMEFLIWNWSTWFRGLPLPQILEAFFQGLRFDLSSLIWLSSLILISALIPWPFIALSLKETTLKTVFLLIHIPFLLINIIDIEVIHFVGRRMSIDNYYLLKESNGKITAVWSTYWFFILSNIALLAAFYGLIQKIKVHFNHHSLALRLFKHTPLRILGSFLLLLLFIVGARGGIQPKPLEMAHAISGNTDTRLIYLTLNSSFTTIHSLQRKRISRLNYFPSTEDLIPLLNAQTPGELVIPWNKRPKNVVLFILESFGIEYTGLDHKNKTSFTPFLDSLQSRSLYFSKSYANGRRSIDAIPSLFASVPADLDEPFVNSPFQTATLPLIGKNLAAKGIWSGFFHGGGNGTMYFQEFTQRIGIEHYIGKNEYPYPEHDDGAWGIWDGPFLKFFGTYLTGLNQQPFFATLFTLSSHHPFKVPPPYDQQLPKGPLPILHAIAYTDQMLREFFATYQAAPWFEDTLFIFTADHTSKSYLSEYQSALQTFRVPILLYFPGAQFTSGVNKIETQEPVQHIDILPTIETLFSLDTQSTQLSRSLLKTGPRSVALYFDGQQTLIQKEHHLTASTEGPPPDKDDPLSKSWMAHRQYFINSLIDNHF